MYVVYPEILCAKSFNSIIAILKPMYHATLFDVANSKEALSYSYIQGKRSFWSSDFKDV